MEWDDLRQWVEAQAAQGGDLLVHADFAPKGAGSLIAHTLHPPLLVSMDQPELISWSAGECTGAIARDDFVAAGLEGETSTAVTVELVSGSSVTLAWSPWPDRKHT